LEDKMLRKRTTAETGQIKVSFALPADDPRLPASVVGEFNEWDPDADPMKPRSNGTWSAVVTLEQGREFKFRYRSVTGEWFNDDQADGFEGNEFASQDCVVRT
jgi:1,4-alpha-glucan branching enzyme